MRHGEEQGGSGVGEIERQGALPGEGSGVPRERKEGRASAEGEVTQTWVEFPLTKGKVALVDVADLLILARYRWSAVMNNDGRFYCQRGTYNGGRRGNEFMHRRIMEPPTGMVVDHINGDGLDNRRANLRVCTQGQNLANRRIVAPNATGFIGVSRGSKNSWRVDANGVRADGGSYIGSFPTALEAAKAYDEVVVRVHGRLVRTNFPVDE